MSHAIEIGSRPLRYDQANIDTTAIPPLGETQRLLAWQSDRHLDILQKIAIATSGQPAEEVRHSFDPDASFGIPMKYDNEGMRRGVSFAVYSERIQPISAMLFHEIARRTDLSITEKLDKIGLMEATALYQAQLLPDGNSRTARALRNYVLHGVEGIADGFNGVGDMSPPPVLEAQFIRHAVGRHGGGQYDMDEVVSGKYVIDSAVEVDLKRASDNITQMVGSKQSAENGELMQDAMHGRMIQVGRNLQKNLGDRNLSAEVATILCQKIGYATLALLQERFPGEEIATLETIDTEKANNLVDINNNLLSSRIIQIIAGIARNGEYFSYNAKESQMRMRRWLPRVQTYEQFVASRTGDATAPPDHLLRDM